MAQKMPQRYHCSNLRLNLGTWTTPFVVSAKWLLKILVLLKCTQVSREIHKMKFYLFIDSPIMFFNFLEYCS